MNQEPGRFKEVNTSSIVTLEGKKVYFANLDNGTATSLTVKNRTRVDLDILGKRVKQIALASVLALALVTGYLSADKQFGNVDFNQPSITEPGNINPTADMINQVQYQEQVNQAIQNANTQNPLITDDLDQQSAAVNQQLQNGGRSR